MRRTLHETEPFAFGVLAALLYVLMIAVLLDAGGCSQLKQDVQDMRADVESVMLHTDADVPVFRLDVGTSSCTAWHLNEQGMDFLVTAEHCCEASKGKPMHLHGMPGDVLPIAANPVCDVCLMVGAAPGVGLQLATEYPKPGALVWVAGFPFGKPARSVGLWGGLVPSPAQCYATTYMAPGYSGAPMMDQRGRVVCGVFGYPDSYPGIAFGCPAARIRDLVTSLK